MLLLKWSGYLRPCVFTTHMILEKSHPLWGLRFSSSWHLSSQGQVWGKFSTLILFYLNHFKNECGFTAQGGFREEGNSLLVCKISENYWRGIYVFRFGSHVVKCWRLYVHRLPCALSPAAGCQGFCELRGRNVFSSSSLPLSLVFI